MNTKLFISCLAVSALSIGGCTVQTNKPPAGTGHTGPVSDGKGGGSTYAQGSGNTVVNRGSGSGGNGSGGVGRNNSASQGGGLGGLGSVNSGSGAGNANGGFGSRTAGNGAGRGGSANGQNQGGFGSGSAYGGNTKSSYTPADLRDPNSILAQRIIYFDYNQSGIKPQYRRVLDAHGSLLADFPQLKVRLEGHADERGSREYNVALSERRAYSVRDYLRIKGVNTGQTDIVGYGEEVPATFGHGESSWSKNRRVEIIYAGE